MKNGLQKNEPDPPKSKDNISKARREKIFLTKTTWKITRMICEDSQSRSWELTR